MFPTVTVLGMSLYDIFLMVGLIVVMFSTDHFAIKRGFSVKLQRLLLLNMVASVVIGLFGAVLFQAVYDWIATGVFSLKSGMTFYGGLIFGVVAFLLIWFFLSKCFGLGEEAKKRFKDVADMAAFLIPLAHGFGRLGCLTAGCCHGKVTDAWYGINMLTADGWQKVVPLQLYEALVLFALSGALFYLFQKRTGEKRIPLLPIYGVVYAIWRFFIEYARADDRGETIVSFMTPSQLIAVILALVCVGYFILWCYLKNKKMENKEKITMESLQKFEEIFGSKAEDLFTAAGRINVIGEHVDYCGGKVFPAALNLRCNVYGKKTGGNKIRMAFRGIEGIVEVETDRLDAYKGLKIGNYQAGVAYYLQQEGVEIVGCDLYYDCTVPFGSGLSSSAAIEVATAVTLCEYAGVPYDKVNLALISQCAENKYAGVNCGIMDQFASAMGKKDHAVLLDCSTLQYEYVPLKLGDYCLVVANCNKPHNLVESKYNERRGEVEEALKIIQTVYPVKCLAEVTAEQFAQVKGMLSEVVAKRAEHVVMECTRVQEAVAALKAGDLVKLGKLLDASHFSLCELYEVTGKELDTLSALARQEPDCLGSRMIGAGFGGCTISIVKKSAAEGFIERVGKAYKEAIGYEASFYETSIEDGITVQKL